MVADDVAGREVDPSPDPGHDLAPAAGPGGDPGAKGAIGEEIRQIFFIL